MQALSPRAQQGNLITPSILPALSLFSSPFSRVAPPTRLLSFSDRASRKARRARRAKCAANMRNSPSRRSTSGTASSPFLATPLRRSALPYFLGYLERNC